MRSLLLLVQTVLASVHRGDIKRTTPPTDFLYMGKFCFDYIKGNGIAGTFNIKTTGGDVTNRLYWYDDEDHSWPSIYKKEGLSCEDKTGQSKNPDGWEITGPTTYGSISITEHLRPRFWYIAVANCTHGVSDMSWELEFLNANHNQYGIDEYNVNYMYFFFVCAFGALLGTWFRKGLPVYMSTGGIHVLIRVLLTALVAATVSVVMGFCHYFVYSSDGVGVPMLKAVGEAMDDASNLTIMLLALLIGKGWLITYPTVQGQNTLKYIAVCFVVLYFATFVFSRMFMNPASTHYYFDTMAGAALTMLRCGVGLWYMQCLLATYSAENQPEKQTMYRQLGGFLAIWFFSLAVMLVLSRIIDPWWRLKSMTAINLSFNFCSLSILSYYFWPTRASTYFKMSASPASSTPYEEI